LLVHKSLSILKTIWSYKSLSFLKKKWALLKNHWSSLKKKTCAIHNKFWFLITALSIFKVNTSNKILLSIYMYMYLHMSHSLKLSSIAQDLTPKIIYLIPSKKISFRMLEEMNVYNTTIDFFIHSYENNKVNKWSVISTPINEYVMCITMIN
jgi:hypothetical protein